VVTTNVFDLLKRQSQVQFRDGTKTLTGYDNTGRRVAETNQDGIVTRFGYDGAGRLTSVTNALNLVTRYQYDELACPWASVD
jgi:YD repeat-containing protein